MQTGRVISILRRPGTIVAIVGGAVALGLALADLGPVALGVALATVAAVQVVHQDQTVRLLGRISERLATDARARVDADGVIRAELRSVGEQLTGRVDDVDRRLVALDPRIDAVGETVAATAADTVARLREATSGHTGELFSRLDSAHWHRERLYAQTEATISLDAILGGGRGLPPLRDWALSPDSAVALHRLARTHEPDLVVELGSGTSTVVLALEAEQRGRGRVVAVDHIEEYAEQTRSLLEAFGVAHRATVVTCPLAPIDVDGRTIEWYDLAALELDAPIDVLVIDGPPSHEDDQARLPAETMFDRLSANGIVVLDDSDRGPERAITERWLGRGDFDALPVPKTEKGIAVLRRRQA